MSNNNFDWDAHNRQQVLQGRQILERTTASIARSNQIAIETEDIGNEVVGELSTQREALLRTQHRLDDANAGLSKSNSVLRAMQRNVIYNKLVLILIIFLEICILCGIVFIKFIKKH